MRKQFGLSLVELMISIVLGLVLMTGVMKLFLSSKVVFSTQQGLSRIQETGRLAISFLSHDISEAAYYGCHRPTAEDANSALQGSVPNAKDLNVNFDIGVIGYNAASALPGAATTILSPAKPVETSATVTAHILVTRSASQQGLIMNAANTATTLRAYSKLKPDSSNCISGVCPGGVAVVADCFKSRVFRVNNVVPAGDTVTVSHQDQWGGSNNVIENFTAGAEILPFTTTVYFLAESVSGVGTSLWQKTNDDPAFELLEGVEQMRVTYALKDDAIYNTAAVVSKWSDVWSVRVDLLVRSTEDNVLAEKQPYTFPGNAKVVPEDKRMRQIFTSTTAIRSRVTFN